MLYNECAVVNTRCEMHAVLEPTNSAHSYNAHAAQHIVAEDAHANNECECEYAL